MKIWDKLTRNKGSVGVGVLLTMFIIFGSCEARSETFVSIGPTQVSSNLHAGEMLLVTERIKDRYNFTMGYFTEQEFTVCDRPGCTWNVRENLMLAAQLSLKSPWSDNFRLSVGPAYFANADRIGTSNFRALLTVEWMHSSGRWGLGLLHASNGGTGQDMEACNTLGHCMTNDWNTGLDSWVHFNYYFKN